MSKNVTEEMKKEIKSLVADITEVPLEELTEEATFVGDLGVDSMMALEIVASIEKRYKMPIPDNKIPTVKSLKDIYQLIEELLSIE